MKILPSLACGCTVCPILANLKNENIEIPASKYPAFKPGKGLKDRVK